MKFLKLFTVCPPLCDKIYVYVIVPVNVLILNEAVPFETYETWPLELIVAMLGLSAVYDTFCGKVN
jgi:hypothetical protein